jgi:alpha-L-fucosidase 2
MAVITFFVQHYKTDAAGVMVMHPAMACETWWNCTDPMPELAGLYAVIDRLLGLSPALTTDSQRKYWQDLKSILPELPLRDTEDGRAFAPAAKYEDKRNCENPELYAVFPFRRTAVGSPDLTPAINALKHSWDKGVFGWRQDDIFMAYLGLTDQVAEAIVERAGNYDKNSRFPAFWGPNYDWVPDQDHGGVLIKTCQAMLIQEDMYSDKIYLLPAWPAHWNASFKLHAAKNTVIEGVVSNGRILDLKVFPETRRKDIIINSGFINPSE